MNAFFNIDDTVFNITEDYPELLPLLVKKGFGPLANPMMRQTMGKKISLRQALTTRNLDVAECEAEFARHIAEGESAGQQDSSLKKINLSFASQETTAKTTVNIEGVLPCPVRLPLLEHFEAFYAQFLKEYAEDMKQKEYHVRYDLQSANLGVKHIVDKLRAGVVSEIPDLTFLTGIDAFLCGKPMKKNIADDVFKKIPLECNDFFCNDRINLTDPLAIYKIIALVPAVLVVNKNHLNGRSVPRSWADILSPEFENSIAIPLNDLDLFNVVLLGVYALFGEDGIKNLARSYHKNLHPSQMTRARHAQSGELPAVNIAPYFFTKMIQSNSGLEAVWPQEGAFISPIFMLVKNEHEKLVEPFVQFFVSEETAEIVSAGGYFPSTLKGADEPSGQKTFFWPGWDFMHDEKLGVKMNLCLALFDETLKKLGK